MALIWADGFDHYGNTNTLRASGLYVYTTNYDAGPLMIGTNPALIRTGRAYWDASQQMYSNWYGGRMIGGNASTLGAGGAFYFYGPPDNDAYCPFQLVSGSKDSCQVSLRLHPDMSLSIHSGRDGEQYGISNPGVIVAGSYSYIEIKVFCDPVQGAIEVRVNNSGVITATGLNTDPLGTGTLTGVMCGTRGGASSGGHGICSAIADFVIWDTGGAINNDFFGDIRCRTIYPAGNGLNQDWEAHGQAQAFNCINQVPPQPGVDYISAGGVPNLSSFNLDHIPNNTGAIYGAMLFANISKQDAGVCTVQIGLGDQGSTGFGPTINPGTGAAYYTQPFQSSPSGGAFDVTKVNAMQALVERVA